MRGLQLMNLPALQRFVFWSGLYNLVLAAGMAIPAVTRSLGINIVDPVLGQLIAGFLLFTAAVQILGARDLTTFGWVIFWEGILRWIAAALLICHGFYGHLGPTAGLLGVGDFLIGAIFVLILPGAIDKSAVALLTGK